VLPAHCVTADECDDARQLGSQMSDYRRSTVPTPEELGPNGPLYAMLRDVRDDVKDLRSEFKENRGKLDQVLDRVTRLEATAANNNSTLSSLQGQVSDATTRIGRLERNVPSPEESSRLHDHVVEFNLRQPVGGCKAFHDALLQFMADHKAVAATKATGTGRLFKALQIIAPVVAVLIAWLLGQFVLAPKAAGKAVAEPQVVAAPAPTVAPSTTTSPFTPSTSTP
jgi:hypothetical protein